MRIAELENVQDECRRLMERIDELMDRRKNDRYFRDSCESLGFRETAAIRRASLDLTRALAKMRRS